jgi:hypothetical protein
MNVRFFLGALCAICLLWLVPGAAPADGAAGAAPADNAASQQAAKKPKPAAGASTPAGGASTTTTKSTTTTTTSPAPAASGTPPGNGAPTLGAPTPDLGNIDQILEGDEEVLAGNNGFTYDPGNRRDPFKSLLIAPDRPEFRGPRPEGIPGLLIDEIDLKGIFRTARGYVAQVSAANQKKSYLLKDGDQLYDGDVVSIGKSEVVFKQIVQDPTALKPFREVVKSLNPQ